MNAYENHPKNLCFNFVTKDFIFYLSWVLKRKKTHLNIERIPNFIKKKKNVTLTFFSHVHIEQKNLPKLWGDDENKKKKQRPILKGKVGQPTKLQHIRQTKENHHPKSLLD